MSNAQRGCLIAIGTLVFAIVVCGLSLVVLPQNFGLAVALPVIQMPGEVLIGTEEAPVLTNTMVATLLADAVVLLLAFLVVRNLKEIPGRLQSIFEMLVEALSSLAKSVAGEKARLVFPLMATIFIFVLTANWLELIPGVDSVGIMHCAKPGQTGYPRQGVLLDVREPLGGSGQVATEADYHACEAALHPDEHADEAAAGETAAGEEAAGEDAGAHSAVAEAGTPLYVVTPFVRAAATDLNFTLAIALVAMVTVQILGFRSLGMSYLYKFINLPALGNVAKKPMGIMDLFVGFLELISEVAKVISFTFRLFGNIFAGQILLFVLPFLIAWILPSVAYGLELFVGAIQAFVFAMLFAAFSGVAMAGHGHDDEH
ncbi:MAG: F0F1 ATP synthase subunit A [Anaerolineae bacterium]